MYCVFSVNDGDAGSDEDDGRSDKSGNEDDEEEAKAGSTPQPEGVDPKAETKPQPGEEDERQRQHKTWQEKDAEYEASIAALPLRTEPIGLDRHHRKYWLLTGMSVAQSNQD